MIFRIDNYRPRRIGKVSYGLRFEFGVDLELFLVCLQGTVRIK